MLIIVADRQDVAAQRLAARWQTQGAELLTGKDFAVAGWCHFIGPVEFARAVVGGRMVTTQEIAGVLTRLPRVNENELTHIAPADRAYVAAETTAFLVSWLSGLTCPVLNRPTPNCLSGPNWRPEQWLHAAAQLGIPVSQVRREATLPEAVPIETPKASRVTVTVVADYCFGSPDEALANWARRIATAAGADLLAVHFSAEESGTRLLGADLWPDVSSAGVADAVYAYLSGSPGC